MKRFEFKRKPKSVLNKPFSLDETIELFLDAKRLQRRSDRTIKTYERALKHYSGYCGKNKLNAGDDVAIAAYIRYMTFEKTKWDDHPTNVSDIVGVSASSVNNAIRVLRVFFNWAMTQKLIGHNPAKSIGLQTEPDKGFELFTDAEIQLLLNTPNHRTYTGFRDYVMMLVLIDTGLRVGELSSLSRGDFELQYRQIVVNAETSKSRKTRTIPVSRTTVKALYELFDLIGIDDEDTDEFVFLTQYGDQYLGDNFAKNIKNYAARAGGLKARVSPHTFRHYFAVKFLRNGGDPFALMKILGHSDISMTQRYVQFASADIKEIHDKASPVESLLTNNKGKKGKIKFR